MKSIKFYMIVLLLFPLAAKAQQVYNGTVLDENTKQPLPFVTVTLVKEKIAASTNDQGRFHLASRNGQLNDSLLFTYVGYLPVQIPVATLAKNRVIQIRPDEVILNQVEVSAKQVKKKLITLNKFTLYNNDSIAPLNPAQYKNILQAAVKFSAPKNLSIIKSIRLARVIRRPNYQSSFDFRNGRCRFRIKIYDVDPVTGGPGNNICKDTIVLQNDKNTFIEADLSSYNIQIPSKDFFIGIEWLIIPFNETITTYFVDIDPVAKKQKKNYAEYTLEYDPILYGVRLSGREKQSKTWIKPTYDGQWINGATTGYNSNIALSATVEVSRD